VRLEQTLAKQAARGGAALVARDRLAANDLRGRLEQRRLLRSGAASRPIGRAHVGLVREPLPAACFPSLETGVTAYVS
jgi:hypothetical protein